MKSLSTVVTERGQVSIPAEVRERLNLFAGMRVTWTVTGPNECAVAVTPAPRPRGARAMLGFASTFCANRKTTADWISELREGEEP